MFLVDRNRSNLDLSDIDYKTVSDYLYKCSGITISIDKKYLLQQRLSLLLKSLNLAPQELIKEISAGGTSRLREEVINVMSTNETFFFRDSAVFETFEQKILPKLVEENQKNLIPKIKIWSAACSTGQELYSIAMIIHSYLNKEVISSFSCRDILLLGTDISENVVSIAKEGLYSNIEMGRGLKASYKMKYFSREAAQWRVSSEIRDWLNFKNLNLINMRAIQDEYDVVLLRNVLIYFDEKTKSRILEKICRSLKVGGYLFLGSTENLGVSESLFETLTFERTIIYKKI
ncbi:protein-glutamate O-methyltransferase CheR [bacterium]|nr:protein-glutamate O-methyltransferase CheR [bacterium]